MFNRKPWDIWVRKFKIGATELTATGAELNKLAGVTATAAQFNKLASIAAGGYLQVVESRSFTETAGAGTWTATVTIPAGAILIDVLFTNTALWTSQTSATLNVGDGGDADGFFAGVDVKSAPAAGATISALLQSTGSGDLKGAYKVYATEGTITATIAKVGSTGTAGRSTMHVIYALPTAVAATKA